MTNVKMMMETSANDIKIVHGFNCKHFGFLHELIIIVIIIYLTLQVYLKVASTSAEFILSAAVGSPNENIIEIILILYVKEAK